MKKILYIVLVSIMVSFLSSCTVRHISDTGDSMSTPLTDPNFAASTYDIVSFGETNFGPANVGNMYHSVAPGETLWRISKMYDVDIETLKKVNGIRNVSDIEIGTKIFIPKTAGRKEIITLYPSKKWKYIVIHHSATDYGNSAQFNKAHINKGWEGVGYHFVIDNGTAGKADGQLETTPRWIKQLNGAHCKAGTMNENGIGICLVGNFSQDYVSQRQMNSLIYLVKELKSYYKIPKSRILGHGEVPGASTECPGKNFPWKTFYSKIGR